jgi:type VI secretion system protein ImpG
MEELLPFYERELSLLRQYVREFAQRNPKIAARLAISGGHSEDPHVERMLESSALLGARISEKIEDQYPEFTEALLEILFPQYLRPIPSCSITQFMADARASQLTEAVTVLRGTALEARIGECRFRTVYDVTVLPLSLTEARYSATAVAPASVQLPADATGLISITFESSTQTGDLTLTVHGETLRIHLAGQKPFASALADTLLMRTSAAFVEADGSGRWKPLTRVPFKAVGFDDRDALLGEASEAVPAVRLLMEFFAFPDKFLFVDVDFARIVRTAGSCRKLTLHLAITNLPNGSPLARAMAALSANSLKLFCTPVINLYKRESEPVRIMSTATSYAVVPQGPRVSNTEVYSIDFVYVTEQKPTGKTMTEIPPYRSLRHDESAQSSRAYWLAHRDPWIALQRPGHETAISLVGIDGSLTSLQADHLSLELTCTNRDLPRTMPFGTPGGDLLNEDASFACTVSMLQAPTERVQPPRGGDALWRLVAQFTPNSLSLGPAGLRALLHQHSYSRGPSTSRLIDSIVGLEHRPCMKWMQVKPLPTFVRGIEIRLTIDEMAFVDTSLNVFAGVMDRFFAPYVHLNSFVQLIILSSGTGAEVVRCDARQGSTAIL